MKHPYRLLVALLALLLLSACGGERIIYVVVTPTAGSGEAAPGGDVTAPLPPPAPPNSPAAASTPGSAGVAVPNSATLPADLGHIALMGPYGASGQFRSYLVNSDGSGLTPIGHDLGESYFPTLSPDGKTTLLVAVTETGDPDIFAVDVASGQSRNLTNRIGQDLSPAWSPDGTQIAFVSEREGGDMDIWLMNADGSESRRLAQTLGQDSLGSWSPDGTQLAYSNKNEVGESLWLMEVASGESRPLLEAVPGQAATAPAWSPDGSQLAFYTTDAGGVPQIFTVRPDGSEQRQITDGSTPSFFPTWSPDGRYLIYTARASADRFDLTALELDTGTLFALPNVQGFATTWLPADAPLADSGFTQGPAMSGVEVDPAVLAAAYKRGDPNAPITIVEFSDYECTFCQQWVQTTYPQLETLIEAGTVQLIYVDFPLNIHPNAPTAAQAARCGGAQGGNDGYWAMHDALFAARNQWSGAPEPLAVMVEVAAGVGLDGNTLRACVESGQFADEVEAGLEEGARLGVSGTPTFFINGTRLVGAQPFEAFQPFLNPGGQ